MAGIQINRTAEGLRPLPESVSADIWKDTYGQSIVQQLSKQVQVPAGGIAVQELTSAPKAEWVNETGEKPVGDAAFANRKIQPYKAALILPFSDEFRRDYTALYNAIVSDMPSALAELFDRTALGLEDAPGENFHSLADATEIKLDGAIEPFREARKTVGANKGTISGWYLSENAAIDLEAIEDKSGRPLLMNSYATDGQVGTIAGKPVIANNHIADEASGVAGFAGDWAGSSVWGTVEGIKFKTSDQATLNIDGTQVNLWQRNMFAVLLEVEYAFGVRNPKRFVKLMEGADPLP